MLNNLRIAAMEQTNGIIIKRDSLKSITLTWQGIPFSGNATVHWRGIPIPIAITVQKTEYSWEQTIMFLHDNRSFHCKLSKWKYMGGSHGDQPPNITTPGYKLNIDMSAFSLSFREEPIGADPDRETEKDPFEII